MAFSMQASAEESLEHLDWFSEYISFSSWTNLEGKKDTKYSSCQHTVDYFCHIKIGNLITANMYYGLELVRS